MLVHILFRVEYELLAQDQVNEFITIGFGREYRYTDILLLPAIMLRLLIQSLIIQFMEHRNNKAGIFRSP